MSKITTSDVQFGYTKSEDTAQNEDNKNMIIFVEPKGNEPGKIFKGGKPYGGEGAESKFAENDTPEIAIGGVGTDYDLGNKTAKEVLEDMLHPEYAPYIVSPTATLSCKMNDTSVATNSIKEVGTKTPKESDYTKGATSKKVVGLLGTYEASNGTPTTTLTKTSGTSYDSVVTSPLTFTVTNTAVCAKGTSVVKSNKGTKTDHVGGNADNRVLLESAAENTTDIELKAGTEDEYLVKGSTTSASHNIIYRYRVYAATVTNGTLKDQGLLDELTVTLKGGDSLCFALPASYTNVSIKEFNANSGKYDINFPYNESAITEKDAADNDVSYTKYTRSQPNGDDIKIKVTFTIG